jgi:hypothetical protein
MGRGPLSRQAEWWGQQPFVFQHFPLDRLVNACNFCGMLWLALAALFSLPVPIGARLPDIRAIFTVDDFPEYLQRAGVSRIVHTRTTIRPDGTIQSCVTELSSGDTKLDAYTCGLIVERARFRPATWTDGSPAYGVIRLPVSWVITNAPLPDDAMLESITPDLDISVNRLPKGAHRIAGVELQVAADEMGHALSCTEYRPVKNDHQPHFPELIPLACQQVTSSLPLSPPIDVSGKPVRSIQTVSVHFKMDH